MEGGGPGEGGTGLPFSSSVAFFQQASGIAALVWNTPPDGARTVTGPDSTDTNSAYRPRNSDSQLKNRAGGKTMMGSIVPTVLYGMRNAFPVFKLHYEGAKTNYGFS